MGGVVMGEYDTFSFHGNQAIIKTTGNVCQTAHELLSSALFKETIHRFLEHLRGHNSKYLGVFPQGLSAYEQDDQLCLLLLHLSSKPKNDLLQKEPAFSPYFKDSYLLHQLVESLYNFWRSYERFLVCYSGMESEHSFEKRPYRTFNRTVESLNHLVLGVYRDICENITGDHPKIYRQLPAGCQTAAIAVKKPMAHLQEPYTFLKEIPVIRQVLIVPPLILDPPMNKRTGQFQVVGSTASAILQSLHLSPAEWLCYPAKVADLTVLVYFNTTFIGLGMSLANLFELADETELGKKPDAIFFYGIPHDVFDGYKDQTIFYEDKVHNYFVGLIPDHETYAYFGYLKKMMLTLHNSIMIKRGRLPVHGAMVNIMLKNGKSANVVIFGDSGAGKSESLEAFRVLAKDYIRDMTIIFDDMGSLELTPYDIIKAYGTETGAFVRLDDLQPGFAFGNLDRSIIMSPQKINARAILPITTLQEVLQGYTVDYFLYANNYENVDATHPLFQQLHTPQDALGVFREGKRMAKGTTTEKGLSTTYFANIFGPIQYKELHEPIAIKFFEAFFRSGIIVAQLRTRLGIPGYETKGPEEAAKALFQVIAERRS
ncbi:phosphoenolpyruvate carboxykinase [Candidatus Woesearchaeota archaeon]|nr:phosphoenolpyruvate carboxykinase [Candidatus Woesearchaeota archaeon]